MYHSIDHLSSVSDNEIPATLKPTATQDSSLKRYQYSTSQNEENESSIHNKKKIERSSSLTSIENQHKIDGHPQNSNHEFSRELPSPTERVIKLTKCAQVNDTIETTIHPDIFNFHRNESSHSQQPPEETRKFRKMKSLPSFSLRPGEEAKRDLSVDSSGQKYEVKEPGSAEMKPTTKEEKNSSFLSDIVISKKRGADEQKKSTLKRGLLSSKPVTISLTFDAFVDQVKGKEFTNIASNYPDYKIDKRLIFLGKEVDFPWHIISYNSTFRKAWNLFILAVITYQIFWYPLAVTFIFGESWPPGSLIFEIISLVIFLLDIVINIRTTYSNDNNEEIIDSKMIRKNYISKKLFIVDIITTLPIPEILILVLMSSSRQWHVYSLVILIRLLRVFKISAYLENRTLSTLAKLLRIFIAFFIVVHWVSCVWYVLIQAEYDEDTPMGELWFPNNLRMVATGDDDLIAYYQGMPITKVYGLTLMSVFMLAVGSDMAPATNIQIWVSVFVGLFGAVSLAYIFGLVTLIITKANQEASLYQQQLEELKSKLKVNKIPHNLRVKVMEYFYYSWRKHSVLKKMDDFSELSIPLQRDIALYQHQEMIVKVPLFKELDPIEILSIIQKLKTSIYMPGDKIIREGERGTEMFFIQEGSVEKLIKKPTTSNRQSGRGMKYERVVLERGSYFGEVALMSNSKRTFDANAFEFCILYTLSRPDYEHLKSEFKDIGPRLRSGLKHYKNTHMSLLIQILQNLEIFKGFTPRELQRVCDEYLEEIFVDPDRVILDPKERINAIYVMLNGTVNCYENNEETRNYLNNLKRSNDKDDWTIVDPEEEEDIECLDDDILSLEKDKHSIEDQKNKLDLVKLYTYGDHFGTLDFDVNEIKCTKYYVSDTGCQIGAITQALKSQMANEDPELYEKLKNNIIKCSPKRVMVPIEEESDSSFTTKNNTFLKARINRRTSNQSDFGKKPMFIKTKKDDILTMKEELQQLEEEMNTFRTIVSETNAKLFRIISNVHNNASEESTPEKSRSRLSNQFMTTKQVEKLVPKKNTSNNLLQVDEVNIEESRL